MNRSPGTIGRPETAQTPCGRGTCSAGALPPGLAAAAAGPFPGAAGALADQARAQVLSAVEDRDAALLGDAADARLVQLAGDPALHVAAVVEPLDLRARPVVDRVLFRQDLAEVLRLAAERRGQLLLR